MRIVYIVSSLKSSGPTNQLYNLIGNMSLTENEVHLVTLSPEPKESRISDYRKLNIKFHSLNFSRFKGALSGRIILSKLISKIKPDIVHTQGIRADSLLSSMDKMYHWVITSHNYPLDDYPMKFGWLIGRLMAAKHLSAMRKCENVVSCSKTIAKALEIHKIESVAIQNGTLVLRASLNTGSDFDCNFERPLFISVGSLIKRKNNQELIKAFNEYSKSNKGTLLILGDGVEKNILESMATSKIKFLGNVKNVFSYLRTADYFVSASHSEGLPNTVLEALLSGVPAILSNIPSHQEISNEFNNAVVLFDLGTDQLAEKLAKSTELFDQASKDEAKAIAERVFSANRMSKEYQMLYQRLVNVTKNDYSIS